MSEHQGLEPPASYNDKTQCAYVHIEALLEEDRDKATRATFPLPPLSFNSVRRNAVGEREWAVKGVKCWYISVIVGLAE